MPIPKGRGRVLRYRYKSVPGHPGVKLLCEVMSKPGPRGGRTVCHKKTKKGS